MGFFDWVGEQFSRADTAAHNTANWIGDGFTHPVDAVTSAAKWAANIPSWYEAQNHGFSSVEAYQDYLKRNPDKDPYRNSGYYGTGNPTADAVLNAVGGVGVNYGTSTGVTPGMSTPQNVLAQRDIEGRADTAIDNKGAMMPNVAMPTNPNGASIGNNSYDFRTEPTNQLGEQRIDLVHPESTVRPTSLGLSPIDVGQPGTDSYANGMQAEKHGYTGVTDQNHTGGVDYTAAGGSTYKAPLVTPGAADPAPEKGNHYNLNDALGLTATAGGVITNLVNGGKVADAEKTAAQLLADANAAALKQAKDQFETQQANIKPWLDAGKAALPKLESFDTDHPRGTFQESPDYAFRLSEGLKALRNTAGAQGSLTSGETMKAMNNYAGNAASQEYGNWYNRQENTRNTDRGALQSLAGIGQSAVGQSNAASQAFGANQAAGTIGMANAMAGGVTGAANANASGYDAAAKTAMSGIQSIINSNANEDFANLLRKKLGIV